MSAKTRIYIVFLNNKFLLDFLTPEIKIFYLTAPATTGTKPG